MQLIHKFINEFLDVIDTLDVGMVTAKLIKVPLQIRREHLAIQIAGDEHTHLGHSAHGKK
ncbi:MAG: hypothetical protein NTW94_07025 [Legionellales bacterium]|nr:hypothetical protein [Legionellales bacterium]